MMKMHSAAPKELKKQNHAGFLGHKTHNSERGGCFDREAAITLIALIIVDLLRC
jgi:hypothetical protein